MERVELFYQSQVPVYMNYVYVKVTFRKESSVAYSANGMGPIAGLVTPLLCYCHCFYCDTYCWCQLAVSVRLALQGSEATLCHHPSSQHTTGLYMLNLRAIYTPPLLVKLYPVWNYTLSESVHTENVRQLAKSSWKGLSRYTSVLCRALTLKTIQFISKWAT